MRQRSTVTLKHVAERAGVAPITVSRAINAPGTVSPGTRALVDAAVADLGYVRNHFAGALASARSRFVPLIVPSLSNSVFAEVIQAVQEVVEPAGYEVLLGNTRYDSGRETELVRTLLGWSPVGLIVAGLRHAPQTRALLRTCGCPIVEIMETGGRPIDMNVGLSHTGAGAMMAHHLIACGYRRLGFIGGRLAADHRALQRFKGFAAVIADAGLPRLAPFTHEESSSAAVGGREFLKALAADPALDALFFANDDLAVGALLRARRENIDVPGRIAIAGFNGFGISALMTPALTTIASPRQQIGEIAARKLLARLENKPCGARRVELGCELVRGAST